MLGFSLSLSSDTPHNLPVWCQWTPSSCQRIRGLSYRSVYSGQSSDFSNLFSRKGRLVDLVEMACLQLWMMFRYPLPCVTPSLFRALIT
ncbi:hypothetical protein M404DRAFT_561780 [Pisolithus tinctorius Marx 270]|uniref:Uncharacterized protein n=1 Tax=Pisolithus tinctorius Marx 270 TaxID=870435 RepID=A0A0C3PW81_PISTI|nr:hypothetical protein M404DRAFT_561780 [Pisolithus tinctorius Marx 270]